MISCYLMFISIFSVGIDVRMLMIQVAKRLCVYTDSSLNMHVFEDFSSFSLLGYTDGPDLLTCVVYYPSIIFGSTFCIAQ
ncbi:E3 ubiquitin-protein ligase SINA-like 1 [Frankliniella fusca]|uniref:E3 ubiquitin-protein ligase SINA-like 1 n=1 Tax=Frankliniella fusca TaxID=407009 RepID=A0AAE1LB94_9NEOP|nr:E3 ubiquitin-protein ligase SINA-like 1 [Frankliniella fusca]